MGMQPLDFLQSIAGFTQSQTSQQSENKPFKLGTIDPEYVVSSFPGTLPKVTFDGEPAVSGKLYPVMSPYWPQPSDRVVLAPVGSTYLILGPVDYDTASYVGGSLKIADDLTVGDDVTLASGSVATWAGDTNLYRSAANVLATDDSFVAGAGFRIGSTSGPRVLSRSAGVGADGPGTQDDTTSSTYVNMTGTSSFSFTKDYSDTDVKVEMALTFFSSSTGSGVRYGVRINSTDYNVGKYSQTLPTAGVHLPTSGIAFISGIPAGTYTVQGRWLRLAGAGTLSRASTDWLSISATEVTS